VSQDTVHCDAKRVALLVSQLVVMKPVVTDGKLHFGLSAQPEKTWLPPGVLQASVGLVPVYSFAVSHETPHCADVRVPVQPVVM